MHSGETIVPGKITHLNVVQEQITQAILRTISDNTTIILVFDTDTNNTTILSENIKVLTKHPHIKAIWCVLQVSNLEDELRRSTDVSEIKQLTNSKTNTEFKRDFIKEKRLYDKLLAHHFDYSKMWFTSATGAYKHIPNDGNRIKL